MHEQNLIQNVRNNISVNSYIYGKLHSELE